MRRLLLAILVFLVVVPLGGLVWLGYRISEAQSTEVRERFEAVVQGRLVSLTERVQAMLNERARRLSEVTLDLPDDDDGIRRRLRELRAD